MKSFVFYPILSLLVFFLAGNAVAQATLIPVNEKASDNEPCKLLKVQAWKLSDLTPEMIDPGTGKPRPSFSPNFGGKMRLRADGKRPDYTCEEIKMKGDNDALGINTGGITRSLKERVVTISFHGKKYQAKTINGIAYFYFNGTPPYLEIRLNDEVIYPAGGYGDFSTRDWKIDVGGVMSYSFVVKE